MSLTVLLVGVVAGVLVPLVFVLVVSGGRWHLRELLLGLLAGWASIAVVNFLLERLDWEESPLATAVAQGLALALVQRVTVTLFVHGWEEDRAAWFGVGFGILESLGVFLPLGPVYHDVLFQGNTVYQLYRKSLYSLFQAVSAMVLARASLAKLSALVMVQSMGYALMLLEARGVISIAALAQNMAFLGVLLAPVYMRALGDK